MLFPTVGDLAELDRLAEVVPDEGLDRRRRPGRPLPGHPAQKADAGIDVRVVERNPPDATFGWGVVFSEETLGALRDADHETHSRSRTPSPAGTGSTSSTEGACSGRAGTPSRRSRGSGCWRSFSSGASLGVDLRFGARSTAFAEGADLVVGADGVNSVVRATHEREFGASIEPEGGQYVWFGTDLVFDAFTFIFRETEHGLFQVHAYPFDERTSTFIVECPESTWRRAGLDRLGEEESLAFCEQLFAGTSGPELLSNRSLWLEFLRR